MRANKDFTHTYPMRLPHSIVSATYLHTKKLSLNYKSKLHTRSGVRFGVGRGDTTERASDEGFLKAGLIFVPKVAAAAAIYWEARRVLSYLSRELVLCRTS